MQVHTLTGLDAQNPLGFLAALGLLRILDDHARRRQEPLPQLSFVDDAQQVAQVGSHLDLQAITGLLLEDAAEQALSGALRLAYDNKGNRRVPEAAGATRDLKPPPSVARTYLAEVAAGSRRDADLAAAFFSELVIQRSKPTKKQDSEDGDSQAAKVKPTALAFTAGPQKFLVQAEKLRVSVTGDEVENALIGPWRYQAAAASFRWDPLTSTPYAYRATNPGDETPPAIPAAHWLALHGIAFFPVFSDHGALHTTAVLGGWHDSVFTWPVWNAPATKSVIASLLRFDVAALSQRSRDALGIHQVLRAAIVREKYGAFTPPSVVPPSAA
jgi:hypothetical protein